MKSKYTNDLESVENFELAKLDNFVGWHCHHRLETHFSDGTHRPINARLTVLELIELGMYYDRPAEELIFMRTTDHKSLHSKGVKMSPLMKLKTSIRMLGNKYNVGRTLSEETKSKISKSHTGLKHTEEAKLKVSLANRGRKWSAARRESRRKSDEEAKQAYKLYKNQGGDLVWNDWRKNRKNYKAIC